MRMRRIGLMALLIFSTVVGALPCPCHVQSFASILIGATAQTSVGDVQYEPCCAIPTKKLPSGGGLPSRPTCPCESRIEITAFPATRIQQTQRDCEDNPVVSLIGANLCYQHVGDSNIALRITNANGGPVLSPRDRLHVLCLLLC